MAIDSRTEKIISVSEFLIAVREDGISLPKRIRAKLQRHDKKYLSLKRVENILKKTKKSDYESLRSLLPPLTHTALKTEILSNEDFTFYLPRKANPLKGSSSDTPCSDEIEQFLLQAQATASLIADGPSVEKLSYDCKIWLWDENQGRAARGRALACSCYEGRQWGITFRKIEESPKSAPPAESFLNDKDAKEICDILYPIIFSNNRLEEHGLIIIAGRTGTAKSKIARKLLTKYLQSHFRKTSNQGTRNPHLLTFEDPIEKDLREAFDPNDPESINWSKVDYTPREKGKDASGVKETVLNALRQTPKVLFVGETRETEDLSKLLEFAGTGHLVITTTHAGSLVEAMANLLRAAEARRPTRRSEVADRTLALIHLKRDEVELGEKKIQVVIPALWHRTPTGVKTLMAEGLSSLLPNNPKPGEENQYSSIGRYWFSGVLVDKSGIQETVKSELKTKLIGKALAWDLEGI